MSHLSFKDSVEDEGMGVGLIEHLCRREPLIYLTLAVKLITKVLHKVTATIDSGGRHRKCPGTPYYVAS